jgi:pimeloyl-ACP methyl ester carboxylesterase
MVPHLPMVWLLLTAAVTPVETQFVQVSPAVAAEAGIVRSAGQGRAVVLVEGLDPHPFKPQRAARPQLRPWQKPTSVLVRTLSRDSDVFAFTYAQTAPVTDIADVPALAEQIQRLHQAGYSEVVLVGFSAGGLIARQFAEDHPTGVSRVIQVCSPNIGSSLAKVKGVFGAIQEPFVQSLTKEARSRAMEERQGKRIPDGVDFVCVVGNGLGKGDGVVSTRSQWPEDLQAQGVPAFGLDTEHWKAMQTEKGAQLIAQLVRERQPRWAPAQVAAARKRLLHEETGGR